MKRLSVEFLSCLLTAVLLLSLTPVSLAAGNDTPYQLKIGQVLYEVFSDHAEVIRGYDNGWSSDLVLPETVDGVPLTAIRSDAFEGWSMEALYLPDSITTIAPWAFRDCINLSYVRMSESLTEIGDDAFFNCTALTLLYLPPSLQRCFFNEAFDDPGSVGCITVLICYPGTPAERYAQGRYQYIALDGDGSFFYTADAVYRTTDGKSATLYRLVCGSRSYFAVPDTIDGLPVTTVGPDAIFSTGTYNINRTMVLGPNITTIEANAFSFPPTVLNVTENLTNISETAFPCGRTTILQGPSGCEAERYAKAHGMLFRDPERVPFSDVPENAWYYGDVHFAYWNGLMKGLSDTIFQPEAVTSRAMIVQVLFNLTGEEDFRWTYGFTDVPDYAWYAPAVNWSRYYGIAKGISATEFAPNNPVTREQAVAILYRFASKAGLDTSARTGLEGYQDYCAVSGYAQEPMEWAVSQGLLHGMTSTTLAPQGQLTRAQLAAILTRFVKWAGLA